MSSLALSTAAPTPATLTLARTIIYLAWMCTRPRQHEAWDKRHRPRAIASRHGRIPIACRPKEYPGHSLVKKITTGGTFRFQHRLIISRMR